MHKSTDPYAVHTRADSTPIDRKSMLWIVCQQFIHNQNISCPEAIMQNDNVLENAPDFIEEICDLLGYSVEEE